MDSAQQVAILGLQHRVQSALEGFAKLNAHRADQEGQYQPPLAWNLTTSLLALTELLADAGLIRAEDFTLRTLIKQVEILESSLRDAAEHQRASTGIIVPLGIRTRPQG